MEQDANHGNRLNVMVFEARDASGGELYGRLTADRSFGVGYAANWEELQAELHDEKYDVVVINGSGSGEESALEINEKIKALDNFPVATILFGGPETVGAARKAFRCGFSEYLPVARATNQDVSKAIQYAATITRDRRQERARLRILERAARYDGTTGLPNSHYFVFRLEQLIAVAERFRKEFFVILLRINEISEIAARFGGKAAERAFLSCANEIRKSARSSDTFGRFNGDTFYYIVDNTCSEPDLATLKARLLDVLTFSLNTDELAVGVSATAGTAGFPIDGSTVSELVESAMGAFDRDGLASLLETKPAAGANESSGDTEAGNDAGTDAADADGELVTRSENRRSSQRRRVFKRGSLIFNNGYSTLDCTIRDISDGGARIATESHFVIPVQLELLIVESGERFAAEKRWQADLQTGLMFLH